MLSKNSRHMLTHPMLAKSIKSSSYSHLWKLYPHLSTLFFSLSCSLIMPPLIESSLFHRRERIWTQQELDKELLNGRKIIQFEDGLYDMTYWINQHPGGKLAVERVLGKDATDIVRLFHPVDTLDRLLPRFHVGTLKSSPTTTATHKTTTDSLDHVAISEDFRQLDQYFHQHGYYKTDYTCYLWEAIRISLCFATALYLGVAQPFEYAWIASAMAMSLFWHQASFIVHDAGHNGITHYRKLDYLIGTILANGFGGLSLSWWKKSHNVHHIATNQPEHDPDIQLVPFFVLSERFFDSIFSTYHQKQLVWNHIWRLFSIIQHWLYYPILAFGRFNLFVQGWLHLYFDQDVYMRRTEIILQCIYWIWYIYFLHFLPNIYIQFGHIMISFIGTSILHVQITLSHFGMSTEEVKEDECFVVHQLRTTMDVDCPWWLDWFHGGLQFQALHHLFPRMPRHKLRSIQPFVLRLCKKHGLTYTYNSFLHSNYIVLCEMAKLAYKAASTRPSLGK
jgi:delta8-fatty-acid desaturase